MCSLCHTITCRTPFVSKIPETEEEQEGSLETRFQQASMSLAVLEKKPNELILLNFYSLYKQATIGDCNTCLHSSFVFLFHRFCLIAAKPGIFDPAGRAKWTAWNDRKGLAKEKAMTMYIDLWDSFRQDSSFK
jgi:diazepam-binding inhibitor (GABA receptor modulating acyl-CoA-binding protein)